MKITKVNKVVMDPLPEDDDGLGYSFILVRLADGNGGSRLVVRASQYESRSEMFDLMQRKLKPYGLEAYCIGEGEIEIYHKMKTISVRCYRVYGKQTVRIVSKVSGAKSD